MVYRLPPIEQAYVDFSPDTAFGKPQLPTLPRKIYTHFIPTDPGRPGCTRFRVASVPSNQLLPGTRYTIQGVWGCSRPYQRDVDLYVSISIDGWEQHVVSGRDLL